MDECLIPSYSGVKRQGPVFIDCTARLKSGGQKDVFVSGESFKVLRFQESV